VYKLITFKNVTFTECNQISACTLQPKDVRDTAINMCLKLTRSSRSTKDFVLSLSNPIRTTEGNYIKELFVPRNTSIFINAVGVNRDTQIWGQDALEWKPERWLGAIPDSVVDAHIPGVYSNT
jgi:hypothetical protein